ncbi:MAG: hypothetical protein ACT4PT_13370 [Methanobacteriota archaeon]
MDVLHDEAELGGSIEEAVGAVGGSVVDAQPPAGSDAVREPVADDLFEDGDGFVGAAAFREDVA